MRGPKALPVPHAIRLSQKDRRIIALAEKNPDKDEEWLARKIGYGSPASQEGVERVRQALAKRGI